MADRQHDVDDRSPATFRGDTWADYAFDRLPILAPTSHLRGGGVVTVADARASGSALPPDLRGRLELGFNRALDHVRVHDDDASHHGAAQMNARAFTRGAHIYFAQGEYQPHTATGGRLVAHEVAHVVQQDQHALNGGYGVPGDVHERAADVAARLLLDMPELARFAVPAIARVGGPVPQTQHQQQQSDVGSPRIEADDPSFLVCMVLCYLGIPPSLWKTAVELFLRAVFEEYRVAYDQARAEAEFRSYREEFRLYTPFKVLKLILTFAVQGKVGLVPIRTAAARALQRRIMAFLLARGASAAAIATAEQVLRKVAIAIEAVFVAGCAIYCGGTAYVRALLEMTAAVSEGLSAVADILHGLGQAFADIVGRSLAVAEATMDPANWDLSALPPRARGDVFALGLYLWARLDRTNADALLRHVGRPLATFTIPPALVGDIAQSMSQAATARTGFVIEFTPGLLRDLTPLTFVQLLHDWRLLRYRRDPEAIEVTPR
jgi:hypothetical protein